MVDMAMKRYTDGVRKGSRPSFRGLSVTLGLTILCVILTGCDGTVPDNGLLRFGSEGEVRITAEVPLQGDIGWLQQVVTWSSDGAWKLFEEIGYRGAAGDENLTRNPGLPVHYAAQYPSLIQLLNDGGAKVFGVDSILDPDLDPDCGVGKTRVTLQIYDSRREERMEWTRCAGDASTLRNVKTEGAGPDTGASRVIQAAIKIRDWTVGQDFLSVYSGSLPYGTLDKGTETGSGIDSLIWFRAPDESDGAQTQERFLAFWDSHTAGSGRAAPEIDWAAEMVLVGAVGVREEVGDSVEVRRLLLIGNDERVTGTRIEVVERNPGDFCAPARRIVRPYHIVVAPKTPEPFYPEVRAERVPCGT